MKPVISYGIVNADTSGPGAFLRAAKWYWDELTDMFAAAGFESVMIPMVPNTENVSRNGAPICTASIKTRFKTVEGYLEYLNDKGIENVEVIGISAQSFYNSLFETGLPIEKFYEGFYEYALDAIEALVKLNGSTLMVSPTPGVGFLNQVFEKDDNKIRSFETEAAICLNHIGDVCKRSNINLTVRNEYWTLMRGNKIDDFVLDLNKYLVSVAPDPAHFYIAGADYKALFEKYVGQAKLVSFTDTKFVDNEEVYKSISPEFPQKGKKQRVYYDLGLGDIDYDNIYDIMKKSGYDGNVLLEPKFSLDIPKGILRARTFWNRLEKNYTGKEAQ